MTFECPCKGRVSVIFLKHELHNIDNVHCHVVICIVFVIDWQGNASNLKCTQFHTKMPYPYIDHRGGDVSLFSCLVSDQDYVFLIQKGVYLVDCLCKNFFWWSYISLCCPGFEFRLL